MGNLETIERELDVARRRDDNHARVRLIPRAIEFPDAAPHLAEYLDELAYAYQQLGRFDDAVEAMRGAVAAGWDGELDNHPSAQALIADMLLHAGRTSEGNEAWLQAERELPQDPWLCQMAGRAYADVGLLDRALPWHTKGLELALFSDDDGSSDMVWMLTRERADTLTALGQPSDDLQLRAEERVVREEHEEQARVDAFLRGRTARRRTTVGLAWFPAEAYARALDLWPSFADDYDHGPYADYCARLEAVLKDVRAQGVAQLALTHNHDRRVPDVVL